MKKRLVIALGGNAILNQGEKGTFEDQMRNVTKTMEHVADLVKTGNYEIVITHGNGPQVGNLLIQQTAAIDKLPEMPMHMCGAMTQGQIGYLIQQSLTNILLSKKDFTKVATVVTQVVVDKNSSGFNNPSKPVGPYYTKEEAQEKMNTTGDHFKEDAGRGWRKVVPSPEPLKILEIEAIRTLMNNNYIVVASGGGGIPVVEEKSISGVEAVIDKDRAAALLGDLLQADTLIILTAVEKVSLHYKKPNEQSLQKLIVAQAKNYMLEGHFAEGSMKPKVEACIKFIEKNPNRTALITHANTLLEALEGKNGTIITK